MKPPKIPRGWKRLNTGTLIQPGDKVWFHGRWKDTIAASTLVPDRWALSQNKAYYIRKKKKPS